MVFEEHDIFEEGNRPHVIFTTEGGFLVEGDVLEKIVRRAPLVGRPGVISVCVETRRGAEWYGFRSVEKWHQAIGAQTLF